MAYSDFAFYSNTYKGLLGAEEYSRLAVRAAAHVDRMTFGRAKTAKGADLEAVKMAECAIVDELSTQEQGGVVASETNDGISRSFATGSVVKSSTQRIYSAAEVYLCNTNLCFAGV